MATGKRAPSKAQKRSKRPKTVAERRLETIVALMVRQAWTPLARKSLARKWGVVENVVERAAAEASRYIRLHMDSNVDDMRQLILSSLQDIAQEARGKRHFMGALKAIDQMSKIYGLYQIPEQTHNHKFEAMTDDEAEVRLNELLDEARVQ